MRAAGAEPPWPNGSRLGWTNAPCSLFIGHILPLSKAYAKFQLRINRAMGRHGQRRTPAAARRLAVPVLPPPHATDLDFSSRPDGPSNAPRALYGLIPQHNWS